MRFTHITAAAAAAFCLTLVSCSLGAAPKTKKFTVVDRSTGRTVSTYSYIVGTDRPNEIHTYGADRRLKASHYLEYDGKGRLASDSVVSVSAAGTPATSVVDYRYEDSTDEAGNLVKSVQTSSTGEIIETHFGYDETGAVRGVVQKSDKALLMKDYPQ